jgi:hypothetical protein
MPRKPRPPIPFIPQVQRVCVWCGEKRLTGVLTLERGWVKDFTCHLCQPKPLKYLGYVKPRTSVAARGREASRNVKG